HPPISTLFPYTTLFRSDFAICDRHDRDESVLVGRTTADDAPMDLVLDDDDTSIVAAVHDKSVATVQNDAFAVAAIESHQCVATLDRKSTRLNSSHVSIS